MLIKKTIIRKEWKKIYKKLYKKLCCNICSKIVLDLHFIPDPNGYIFEYSPFIHG